MIYLDPSTLVEARLAASGRSVFVVEDTLRGWKVRAVVTWLGSGRPLLEQILLVRNGNPWTFPDGHREEARRELLDLLGHRW